MAEVSTSNLSPSTYLSADLRANLYRLFRIFVVNLRIFRKLPRTTIMIMNLRIIILIFFVKIRRFEFICGLSSAANYRAKTILYETKTRRILYISHVETDILLERSTLIWSVKD